MNITYTVDTYPFRMTLEDHLKSVGVTLLLIIFAHIMYCIWPHALYILFCIILLYIYLYMYFECHFIKIKLFHLFILNSSSVSYLF